MVTKLELLKHFQKNPEKYWNFSILKEKGFVRKVCPKCGKGYWTLDPDREHCPSPECGEEYSFIGKPVGKKMSYVEMWKEFEKFFKNHGHSSIPRYPVVARWRDDIYYTIASIVDFQRFDNGVMTFDYPANPLIVPQFCLRFNDIGNVGVTGRHHTGFVMPGQHAFNWPKEGYWKDRCLELNFEFLTKVLRIPEESIVYVEELWSMPDFSAFGPYIEAYSNGLELVNSGFMEFTWDNGIKPLPMKVVDVGWGLERLVWIVNGTPTGYDAVFDEVIRKFKSKVDVEYDEDLFYRYSKISGKLDFEEVADVEKLKLEIAKELGIDLKELKIKIEPVQAMYAILDHTRTLAFAISDGVLPSNSGAGYSLRMILRRSLGFIKKFGWNITLGDIVHWHVDQLEQMFPELKDHENEVIEILGVEEKKYDESRKRVRKIISTYSGKELSIDKLIELYDSHGISPEDLGVSTPYEFYKKVSERHLMKKKEKEKLNFDVSGIPETKILFYDPVVEFKARVIKVFDNWVVLDRTAFYPTQGGQHHDTGKINGLKVTDVVKIGKVILHKVEGKVKEGDEVIGKVDVERRKELTRHHDAVHIINGLVKKMIGSWCNQAGSEVRVDGARLDITHFKALSEEEIEKIEKRANEIIEEGLPIVKSVLPRLEAEKKYGFTIYQGGYVPSKQIRIVEIPGIDVEACGGTHGDNTKDVGLLIITKTKKISDSVVRIELKAGEAAENWLREKESILKEVSRELNTNEDNVLEVVEKLFDEWKKLRKEIKKRKK